MPTLVTPNEVTSVFNMVRSEFWERLEKVTTPQNIFDNCHTIYEYMSNIFREDCRDSILREWAFEWWSEKTGESYDLIYGEWLGK